MSGNSQSNCTRLQVWLLVCFGIFLNLQTAMADNDDIIEEVRKALAHKTDMTMVSRYLQMSKDELTAILINKEADGYTFFAPKNWAFISMLPQDIADPFFVDAELRLSVLLHHFVKHKLAPNDLATSSEILMADGKSSKITRSSVKSGVIQINEANIEGEPIPLDAHFGNIYTVDRVFTTREEIEKSIRKFPPKETPWGPVGQNSGATDMETQTVVVDLVAELLSDPNFSPQEK